MEPIVNSTILNVVRYNTRTLFLPLFLIVYTFAIIGNCLAIYATLKRKYKIIQKTCIIFLAIADISCATSFTVTSVEAFIQEIKVWTMGSFLCKFLPMAQLHTSTADTMILLIIALDRYYNIMYAKSKQFDPNMYICVLIICEIFIFCTVLAYPMFVFFDYYGIIVHYENEDKEDEPSSICVSALKENKFVYYLSITLLIFVPIMLCLIWFYFTIAKLIWLHRKPVNETFQQKTGQKSAIKKTKNQDIQVERKMRAFKIIIVLMIVFILLRLPFWIYFNITLAYILPNRELNWNLHYTLTLLTITNCALNPMLYTFLNQTMYVLRIANDFVCKIFCCCFSTTEFDELEKDNPFMVENNSVKTETPKKQSTDETESSKNSVEKH